MEKRYKYEAIVLAGNRIFRGLGAWILFLAAVKINFRVYVRNLLNWQIAAENSTRKERDWKL